MNAEPLPWGYRIKAQTGVSTKNDDAELRCGDFLPMWVSSSGNILQAALLEFLCSDLLVQLLIRRTKVIVYTAYSPSAERLPLLSLHLWHHFHCLLSVFSGAEVVSFYVIAPATLATCDQHDIVRFSQVRNYPRIQRYSSTFPFS